MRDSSRGHIFKRDSFRGVFVAEILFIAFFLRDSFSGEYRCGILFADTFLRGIGFCDIFLGEILFVANIRVGEFS